MKGNQWNETFILRNLWCPGQINNMCKRVKRLTTVLCYMTFVYIRLWQWVFVTNWITHLCILLLLPCICCSDCQKPDLNDPVSLVVVWNYSLFLLFGMQYKTWGLCEYVSQKVSGMHCNKTTTLLEFVQQLTFFHLPSFSTHFVRRVRSIAVYNERYSRQNKIKKHFAS